jgi:azurin
MKLCSLIFCAVAVIAVPLAAGQAAAPAKTKPAAAANGEARTIELTASETMKYDKTQLTARPGEKVKVVLKAVGTMPKVVMAHNFVLLQAGASALEVNNAAFNARATDFIPESMKDKIIAFTPLAGAGETVDVTFTAPKAGSYPFMCTFPGHFAGGMKGTLVVK